MDSKQAVGTTFIQITGVAGGGSTTESCMYELGAPRVACTAVMTQCETGKMHPKGGALPGSMQACFVVYGTILHG